MDLLKKSIKSPYPTGAAGDAMDGLCLNIYIFHRTSETRIIKRNTYSNNIKCY